MTWEPNWKCSRTQKRIRKAIGFAVSCFGDKPKEWSSRSLDTRIGHRHKPLGRYLRNQLLIECDERYLFGTAGSRCKTYRLNRSGVTELINLCDEFDILLSTHFTIVPTTKQVASEWVEHAFPEIQSGVFEYKDSANRLWHPLQSVRSEIRKPLPAEHGYRYEYDIECAASTLIYQLARESGLTHRSNTRLIELFLQDPKHYRCQLAQEIGTTPDIAKRIINARFAGATLRAGRSLDRLLDCNLLLRQRLQHNEWFREFSKQIKKCWDKIKLSRSRTRLSPRDKWAIYFEQERRVMGVVRAELNKMNTRYFLEHDGWRCDSWIDPHMLELKIHKRLNKRIKFSYVIWAV